MPKKSVNYVSRQLPLQGLDLDSEYHSQESTQSERLGQKPIDSNSIGLSGESLVSYLLHMWEYNIYEPVTPTTSVDFAIKKGDKWATIQVKTTEKKEYLYLKRTHNRRTANDNVKYFMYSEDDFDFLFLVKFPKIYIIPHRILEKQNIIFRDYEDYAYDLTDPEVFNNPPKL